MSRQSPDFTRFWEEFEVVFDPEKPVEQPRLFAERERKYSAVASIVRGLRPEAKTRSKYLLTGTQGNGKTSELIHCAAELAKTRIVVRVDIWDHLTLTVGEPAALERLEPWELVSVVGTAIFRAGTELGQNWTKPETKAVEKALAELHSDGSQNPPKVDLVTLARGIAVAVGGIAGAFIGGPSGTALGSLVGEQTVKTATSLVTTAADATSWTLPIGQSRRRSSDQDPKVQALLSAVNRLIMSLHETLKRPLVLILDGLDRLRDEERVSALFVRSDLLSRLICDAIVTAPMLAMRVEAPLISNFKHKDLGNIPVVDRDAPERLRPHITFFTDLARRRINLIRETLDAEGIACPDDPLPKAQLDRLAYLSGGVVRDFVRLVRLASSEALDTGAEQISKEHIEPAIRELRLRYEWMINADEIAVLRRVMDDPSRRLPGGELARSLLRQKRLLPYPNDSTWYYPHPLLTLGVLRPG